MFLIMLLASIEKNLLAIALFNKKVLDIALLWPALFA